MRQLRSDFDWIIWTVASLTSWAKRPGMSIETLTEGAVCLKRLCWFQGEWFVCDDGIGARSGKRTCFMSTRATNRKSRTDGVFIIWRIFMAWHINRMVSSIAHLAAIGGSSLTERFRRRTSKRRRFLPPMCRFETRICSVSGFHGRK